MIAQGLPGVVFMGTPAFAVPALEALRKAGYPIKAVYTQPPRSKGRGQHIQKSAVHVVADSFAIPVLTPERLRDEVDSLRALKPDLIVVAAYGQLLPASVLEIPPWGCVNIHASLLPRWRGASPIQRSILAGDASSGITLMLMDEGMDTGPILEMASCALSPQTTTLSLTETLAHLGARALIETLPLYLSGRIHPLPQPNEGVEMAPKIKPAEGTLQWASPAPFLERQVRAFHGSGSAFFRGHNRRFKVHTAACEERPAQTQGMATGTILDDRLLVATGEGTAFRPLLLTPEGQKPMTVEAFLRGQSLFSPGDVLP